MTAPEPEVDFVPESRNVAGYVTQPARYFVSQAGWGRRFATREDALAHVATLDPPVACYANSLKAVDAS